MTDVSIGLGINTIPNVERKRYENRNYRSMLGVHWPIINQLFSLRSIPKAKAKIIGVNHVHRHLTMKFRFHSKMLRCKRWVRSESIIKHHRRELSRRIPIFQQNKWDEHETKNRKDSTRWLGGQSRCEENCSDGYENSVSSGICWETRHARCDATIKRSDARVKVDLFLRLECSLRLFFFSIPLADPVGTISSQTTARSHFQSWKSAPAHPYAELPAIAGLSFVSLMMQREILFKHLKKKAKSSFVDIILSNRSACVDVDLKKRNRCHYIEAKFSLVSLSRTCSISRISTTIFHLDWKHLHSLRQCGESSTSCSTWTERKSAPFRWRFSFDFSPSVNEHFFLRLIQVRWI